MATPSRSAAMTTAACRSHATALLLTLKATAPYVSRPEPFPPHSRATAAHNLERPGLLLSQWRDVALQELRELVAMGLRNFISQILNLIDQI